MDDDDRPPWSDITELKPQQPKLEHAVFVLLGMILMVLVLVRLYYVFLG